MSGFSQLASETANAAGTPSARPDDEPVRVSIVIPLFNEAENVEKLCREIADVVREQQPETWEVVLVDDGSKDGTLPRLREAVACLPNVTIVELTRRFGQTAGLAAGIREARGAVIVPMDGDLQNDPRDIPRLVRKLDEAPGWDVVSGWRKDRRDPFWTRRVPSILANRLIRRLTRTTSVHDFGCSLKAFRRGALEDVQLYGEMHRYLPAICRWHGARVTELVVHHRKRLHGSSKYGLRRTAKVLLDLITVKFLGDYLTKPLYFFGKGAALSLFVSFLSLGTAIVQKLGYFRQSPLPLNRNILVTFAMMLFLTAVMLVMMGVLSELLVRIYHQTHDSTYYKIRRVARASVRSSADPGDNGRSPPPAPSSDDGTSAAFARQESPRRSSS